jgi:hypothetical protein
MSAKKVAPEDLWDSHQVAEHCGWASNRVVSVYRARYDDFPDPVLEGTNGLWWDAKEVIAWRKRHQGR